MNRSQTAARDTIRIAALALLLALGAAGCDRKEGPVEEAAEEVTEASPILDAPLDGSSPEAFEAGMEKVAAEATEAELRRVRNALELIRNYDLAIRSNPSLFYSRMNGKTPNEVVKLAEERYGL